MGSSVEDLEDAAKTPLDELPGLFESLLPALLVIVLAGADTTVSTVYGDEAGAASVTGFFGNPSLALTIAALVAALTYFRLSAHTRSEFSEELTEAFQNGGNIAAITAVGGSSASRFRPGMRASTSPAGWRTSAWACSSRRG